jgi:hypothetical protein
MRRSGKIDGSEVFGSWYEVSKRERGEPPGEGKEIKKNGEKKV